MLDSILGSRNAKPPDDLRLPDPSGYHEHCGRESADENASPKNAEPESCPEPRPDIGKRFAHCANLILAEVLFLTKRVTLRR